MTNTLRPRPMRSTWLVALAALASTAASAQTTTQGEAQLRPGQQVVLVTGSTDELGREVARRLAEGGAHVIVHGRNRERGDAVVREIESAGKGSARFYAADLGSLAEVRSFAAAIQRDYPRIDVLVNNAGIWLTRPPERQLSADGHELHFAVNYLAGYALTHLLLPRLIARAPARIVNVSSGAQAPIDFDDLKLEQGYNPTRAYSISKLAQVMFTIDLDGGAAAVLQLVTAPGIASGEYYDGLRPGRANAQAYDREARSTLRALSQTLTGMTPAPR